MGILKTGPCSPHGIRDDDNGLVLPHHAFTQLIFHVKQFFALALHHLVNRNSSPPRHDFCDLLGGYLLLEHPSLRGGLGELLLQLRDNGIHKLASTREIAAPLHALQFAACLIELLFDFLHGGELFLLRLPNRGEIGRFLFQLGDFLVDFLEALLRRFICLFLQGLTLDLKLNDAAVDFVDLLRLGIGFHADAASRLVHKVNGFVRQKSIGDVAIGQGRGGDNRTIGNANAVMDLVFFFETAQDRNRLLDRRLANKHRLEASSERRVLLDMLSVLVQRRCADAVQFATRKRRLEHIGSIHRPFRLAGANQGVEFVNEQNDVARAAKLLQHGLEALFKFASIFGPSQQRSKIERQQPTAFQGFRHITLDDALRQAFHDRRLSDSWLADQNRVVLGPSRKHLNGAPDLFVTTNNRIELVLTRLLGEITRIFLERVIALFGRCRVRGSPFPDVTDRLVERLRRDTCALEEVANGAARHRQSHQHIFDGDVGIAGFLR